MNNGHSAPNMNQILDRVEKLRATKQWNETAFRELYPLAWLAAGDRVGAISAFIGEGRVAWGESVEKPDQASIDVAIEQFHTKFAAAS